MSLAGKHIELNIASHNKHVPEAEHYNPTIKERCRCIFSTLPYNKVPKRMIVTMARNATFYLNAFPWDDGMSNELAPTTSIATGIAPDYSLHFQVAYGTYAQTRDKTDNTMKARNDRCHCHGTDAKFPKGQIISRTPSGYTISSMPDKAIQRIERLAHSSCPGLHFTSINNEPDASKNDDNDDSTYSPSSDEEYSSDSSHNDDDPDDHTTPAPAGVTNANVNYEEEPLEEPPLDTNITGVAIVEPTIDGDEEEMTGVATVDPPENEDSDDETTEEEADKASIDKETDDHRRPMDNQFEYQYFQGTLEGTPIKASEQIKPLSPHEKTNYNVTLQYIETDNHKEQMIEDYILTQSSLQTRLKKFGKAGMEAIMKKLKQMMGKKSIR
eukprot:jgi/Psemu1/21542/gm1.21542_g